MCINNIIYNVAKCNLGKVKHRTCWPVASTSNHMQSSLWAFATSLKNFTALLLYNLFCSDCLIPCIHFSRFAPSPPSLWMCLGKYLWNSPLRFSNVTVHSKCHSQGFCGYSLCSPVAHSVFWGMAPSPHPSSILAMGLNVNKS